MDFKRAFEVVTGRIKELEPQEVAMRIMGFLLLQCKDEEMIRLAHVPDHAIENVVHNAKNELGRLASNPLVSLDIDIPPQFSSFPNRGLSSPIAIEKPMPNWDACVSHMNGSALSHHDALAELRAKTQCMSLGNGYEQGGLGNFSSDEAFGNISGQISRRSPASPDFPMKQCHFFRRGFCKYGNSCPYSHEQVSPGSILPIFPPGADHFVNDESLERLEMDIIKLLKMRGGGPIPISTLPGIFSDTYGRPLQADGYLTESQRNGKAGYGLSKLLARLKNSICVIDRPHGQHSIILAEDVPKYLEYRSGRNGPGPIVSGSRQIYLTFPAESSFTEDDVAEYFSEFGTVVDVRMPCHQERMFGFVSFSSPDTVTTILSKPNPHFVSGSRVLVKPYREKPKLPNRRFTEDPVYYSQPYAADLDYEFLPRVDAARLFRKQLMEEYVRGLDLQNSMGFQLARNAVFPLPGNHDHLPDSPTNQFTIDHAANHSGHINTASESSAQENGLPDSPFSSHYQEVLPQPAQHNHGKSEEL